MISSPFQTLTLREPNDPLLGCKFYWGQQSTQLVMYSGSSSLFDHTNTPKVFSIVRDRQFTLSCLREHVKCIWILILFHGLTAWLASSTSLAEAPIALQFCF
jgi:hypothetical protein